MNAVLRPLAVLTVVALTACGTYDPETRLFRQLAPKPEDVVVDAPGAETFEGQEAGANGNQVTQGMAVLCTEDRLRCHAQNIATGINGVSFFLLSLVDAIVQFPPSSREPGKRVWGPHYNRGAEDNTARFEMTREPDGTFSYCLHVGPGDLRQADWSDISCADDINELAGAVRLISGTLEQTGDEDGGVRSGAGVAVFEPLNTLLVGVDSDPPVNLTIAYDNTAGTDISFTIDEVGEGVVGAGQCDLILGTETYRYTRDDEGAGTFRFLTQAEFVPGMLGFNECETLAITAQWHGDRAGRADAVVCGGDLGDCPDDEITATECWDDQLTTTFSGNSLPEDPDEGDVNTCAFAAPLE